MERVQTRQQLQNRRPQWSLCSLQSRRQRQTSRQALGWWAWNPNVGDHGSCVRFLHVFSVRVFHIDAYSQCSGIKQKGCGTIGGLKSGVTAVYAYPKRPDGSTATFTCSKAALVVSPANAKMTCNNGKWTGSSPTCIPGNILER